MKKNRSPFLIPLFVVLAITAILAITLAVLEISDGKTEASESTEPTETEPNEPEIQVPAAVFKSNLEEYENYMNTNDEKYLLLVNKTHPLSASFKPESLIPVKDANKEVLLEATAAAALEAMFIEMRREGFTNVFVTSAYRDYEYQNQTFNGWVNYEAQRLSEDAYKVLGADYIKKTYTSNGKTKLSLEDAERVAESYSARAGTSEHQTGLCVDLMTTSMSALDESFANQAVYPWLLENAWKFGFILRFPADKTEITGYSFEPWHYRFVGRNAAYLITAQGLCLEEFR